MLTVLFSFQKTIAYLSFQRDKIELFEVIQVDNKQRKKDNKRPQDVSIICTV